MSFCIAGLGTALPAHAMSQVEAEQLAQRLGRVTDEQARLLGVLFRRSGVKNRYTVLPHRIALEWLPPEADPDSGAPPEECLGPTTAARMEFYSQHAGPLAAQASRAALAESSYAVGDITHLITVSCTGFAAPGVDIALIEGLGLRPTTERVNIGFMGCHGLLNGLRVAQAIAGNPDARILLCAVELCSLHYRFPWDPDRMMGNLLFADGAAALVGCGDPREDTGWQVIATGSCLLPDSTGDMSWRIGDHGFEMVLSARVPALIQQYLRPWLCEWLAGHDIRLEEVGAWAVHPGGPRIVSAVEESLGLPATATQVSRDVLAECGNMSSPTVLFIFDRLRRAAGASTCVMLGFGPGLVAEAALLRRSGEHERRK